MPIILNPEKNNTDWMGAGTNLGTAIFGNATDRANRDLRATQMQNQLAEAEVNRVKARRGQASLDQFVAQPQLRAALVRLPGETEYQYNVRTAPTIGLMGMINPESNASDIATQSSTLMGQGAAQGGTGQDLRLAATLFGHNPTLNDAFTSAELGQGQAASLAEKVQPAHIAADAAMYGDRLKKSSEDYRTNIQSGDSRYRSDREFPFQVVKMGKDDKGYPVVNGKLDREHPIYGTAGEGGVNAPDVIKTIPAGEQKQLEERTLEQSYPGLTHRDNKGRVIISPRMNNSGLSATALGDARAAGEKAYKVKGNFEDYMNAYTAKLGHAPGTKFVDTASPWGQSFGRQPYGEWQDQQTATAVQARRPDLAGASATPVVTAATGQQTAAPARPAASVVQQAATGQRTAAPVAAPAAAPVPDAARVDAIRKMAPTIKGNDDPVYKALYPGDPFIAPDGTLKKKALPQRGTDYAGETESVTAGAGERPALPSIAAPKAPSATMPDFRTAKTPVESNIVRAVARAASEPAPVEAPPSIHQPRAPEAPPPYMPTQWDFTDLDTAKRNAADPNQPDAVRLAANEAVARLQGVGPQKRPLGPQHKATTFLNMHDAVVALAGSRMGTPTHTAAQNFIDNANAGL